MGTFGHGRDEGGALLVAVVAIYLASAVFLSLVPRVVAKAELAERLMAKVLADNERDNRAVRESYDLR